MDLQESFDDELSTSVSLSEILDAFIMDLESPKTIVVFLKQHDDSFKSIISNSLFWKRMFQLDFILRCGEEEVVYLLSKLKSIPGKVAAYCCWQILASKSGCADSLKFRFRREMNWILDSFATQHPYKSMLSKEVRAYDEILARICNDSEWRISDFLNKMPPEMLSRLLSTINYSLFRFRILQLDVFQELSEVNKLLFLKSLKDHHDDATFLQIFTSQESYEVRQTAVDMFIDRYAYGMDRKPDVYNISFY